MTTPTRKKLPRELKAAQRLAERDRRALVNLLGRGRLGPTFDRLEQRLMLARQDFQRVRLKPMPAHLRAELEPIARCARDLDRRLAPDSITLEVMATLVVDVPVLRLQLLVLIDAAEQAVALATGSSDGGAINQREAEHLELARRDLSSLYRDLVPAGERDETEAAEFLAICRRFITAA